MSVPADLGVRRSAKVLKQHDVAFFVIRLMIQNELAICGCWDPLAGLLKCRHVPNTSCSKIKEFQDRPWRGGSLTREKNSVINQGPILPSLQMDSGWNRTLLTAGRRHSPNIRVRRCVGIVNEIPIRWLKRSEPTLSGQLNGSPPSLRIFQICYCPLRLDVK